MVVNLSGGDLKMIIELINPSWRATFLRALFESLNDRISDINNDAYLLGQHPNFTPILDRLRLIVNLVDHSDTFDSLDHRQIFFGLRSLPQQIESFEAISTDSLDKILNISFVRELVS